MSLPIAKIQLRLMEVFFILSFWILTYASNAFIVYGAAIFLFWMVIAKQKHKGAIIFSVIFVTLVVVYMFAGGGMEVYRAFKTMVLFSPFYLADSFKNESGKALNMPVLHGFMVFAAIWVCVDTILYYTVGFTFGRQVVTGIMFRGSGPFEDSNFYSYAMVSYLMALKYMYGRKTKLFIFSVIVSGSVSAIGFMLLLLLAYKMKWFSVTNPQVGKCLRNRAMVIASVLLLMGSYFMFVQNSGRISEYVQTTEMHPAIKFKLWSMMLRFEAQSQAINTVVEQGNEIFGAGAGASKKITSNNMNLHNTYYQIFVEMGAVMCASVVLLLLYYLFRIKDNRFLLIFGGLLILGNMLEVYYMPILQFAYFLYQYKTNYV